MRTCPVCGTNNPDAVGACLTCGASLKGAARTAARMDIPQARTMAGLRPVSMTAEVPVVSPLELAPDPLEEPAGASFDDQSWDVEALFGEAAAREVRSLEAEVGISGATEALRRPARADAAPAPPASRPRRVPESRPGRVPAAPTEEGAPRADRKTLGPWNFQGGLAALANQINATQRDAEDNTRTQGPWGERAASPSKRTALTEPLPSGRALLNGIQEGEEPPQRASRKTVMGLPTARPVEEPAPAASAAAPQRRGTLLGAPSPFDSRGAVRARGGQEAEAEGEALARAGKGAFFPTTTEPEHPAVIARAPAKPYTTGEVELPQAGLFKVPGKIIKKRRKDGEDGPPPPRPSRSVGQYVMRGEQVAESSHEAPREVRPPLATAEEEVAAARLRPAEPNPGALRTLNLASAPSAALLGKDARDLTLPDPIPAVTAPMPFPLEEDFDGDSFMEGPEADPLDMDEFEISAFSGGGYQHPDEVDLDGGITDLGPALAAQPLGGVGERTVQTDVSLLQEHPSWPGGAEMAHGETYPMGVEVAEALSRARPARREPTMEADRPDRRPTVQDHRESSPFLPAPATPEPPSQDEPWPAPAARSGPATEITAPPPSAGPATDIIAPSPTPEVKQAPAPAAAAPVVSASQGLLRASGALAGAAMLGGAGALLAQLGLDAALALDEVSLLALAFPLLGGLVAALAAALPLPVMMRAAIIALVGAISVMLLSVAEAAPMALVGDPARRALMALCLALPMALIWRARAHGSLSSRAAVVVGMALVALNYLLLGIGPAPVGTALEAALGELQSGAASRALLGGLALAPLALLVPSISALLGGRSRLASVWAGGLLGWLLVFCAAMGVVSASGGAAPLLAWVGLGSLSFGAALALCAGLAEGVARLIQGDQLNA